MDCFEARVFTSIAAVFLAAATNAGTGPTQECERPVHLYSEGRPAGDRCPADTGAAGMTVLDLGDAWAPYPFDGAAAAAGVAPPAYRDTLVELGDQRFGSDTLAAADHDLELYGVSPSPRVVLAAMEDERRHRCHDAIPSEALRAVHVPLRREDRALARARREAQARRRVRLATILKRRGETEPARLAAAAPAYAHLVAEVERDTTRTGAVAAVQAHLVCDGLLTRATGDLDDATARALGAYQRRNWIVARGELDSDTRDALVAGSREQDLRLALRMLRQRVTDATGLIADGSARAVWGTVLGRQLDPADMRYQGTASPLADGAPDGIAPATESAARALGWIDFAATRSGLRAVLQLDAPVVAVRLPPVPVYSDVRAVIDREPDADRSVLTVYAHDGATEVALVRWPTTVGGWKPEKLPGGAIVRKHKSSDAGPRVWRDLVVAPVWYAPATTPDADLVGLRDGRWTVKEDLIGPGYRSAYGLVMLVHHQPVLLHGHTFMLDHKIRTHGTVSYRSILAGDSHGCHRLYNHHALRLATFLLRNRDYVVRGALHEPYDRRVRWRGRVWYVHRDSRGFRYELTPPVPIDVTRRAVD